MSGFSYQQQTDISAEALMAVIVDFSSYPQFLSSVKEAQIKKRKAPNWEVQFSLEVIRSFEYTLSIEQRGEYEIHWSLIGGFFQKNNGYWKLTPQEQGTSIEYYIEMEMDAFLPDTIRNTLSRHRLPKMVASFVEEARRRIIVSKIDLSDN